MVKSYSQRVYNEDTSWGETGKVWPIGEKILGIAQKAEKDPQDVIFGDNCKRQKVIPKDVLEEKCGQTIQSKSIVYGH